MTAKHAICIIAHKNVEQINLLLKLLDHPLIDFYLHLDKKSQLKNADIEKPVYSQITFVDRHDVRWGDISLIETELELFRAVVESGEVYAYVHLISGQDMPTKSPDYILNYFDKKSIKGKEFVTFWQDEKQVDRLKYYWLCTKHMRNGILYKIIRHSLLLLQKITHVNRLRNAHLVFKYGSEWVSLTYNAVHYLVSEYPKYQGVFKYTVCADELYKQMLLWGGQFHFSEKGNLRYAKFIGPSPEIIHSDKVAELVANPNILFARKFDMSLDRDCIKDLVSRINKFKERNNK